MPESDFVLYDDFQSRNLIQLARQSGLNYVTSRNAVTKMIMALDLKLGSNVRPSISDVIKHTVDDRLMNTMITFANGRSIRTSDAAIAYALYKIAMVHSFDVATTFFLRTERGDNLNADDPRLHLNRFLTRSGVLNWSERNRVVVAIIKAFNAWFSGTSMQLLQVKTGHAIPDVVGDALTYKRAAKPRND